jgi:hypothetical protein
VKKFNYKNVDRTTRGWRGIGLRKDPIVVSEGKLLQGKNSCKQRRRETSVQQLSENFQKPLEDSPYEKGFEKDRKKLLQGEKLLQEVVTAPLSWEEDGLTIRYMPEGE